MLQARGGENNQNPVAQDILKILYASEDEKVQVSSDGQLIITNALSALGSGELITNDLRADDEMLE